MVGWTWWDWSLIHRTSLLQCCNTVGWVVWLIWPRYHLLWVWWDVKSGSINQSCHALCVSSSNTIWYGVKTEKITAGYERGVLFVSSLPTRDHMWQPRRAADMSTNWWQSLLCCCCSASMEHADDGAETAAIDGLRTCFVVIWKHFSSILSTGTRIRIDSVMRPRSSSGGRNTSASVTVTWNRCVWHGTLWGLWYLCFTLPCSSLCLLSCSLTTQKQCILVCNSTPYQQIKSQQSLNYADLTCEQLLRMFPDVRAPSYLHSRSF